MGETIEIIGLKLCSCQQHSTYTLFWLLLRKIIIDSQHDKINKMSSAPSEGSLSWGSSFNDYLYIVTGNQQTSNGTNDDQWQNCQWYSTNGNTPNVTGTQGQEKWWNNATDLVFSSCHKMQIKCDKTATWWMVQMVPFLRQCLHSDHSCSLVGTSEPAHEIMVLIT